MDLQAAVQELLHKGSLLWQAFQPRVSALQQRVLEEVQPHAQLLKSRAREAAASAALRATEAFEQAAQLILHFEETYPGAAVLVTGLAIAVLALLWERVSCRTPRCLRRRLRQAAAPEAEHVEESDVDDATLTRMAETVEAKIPAPSPAPAEPKPSVIHVASPQRRRLETDWSEPSTSGVRMRTSNSLAGTAEMLSSSRRRSATPVPQVVQEERNPVQATVQLEARNPTEVLEILNTMSTEELYRIRGVGPVLCNKILMQRRRGGFRNYETVLDMLGKTHAQRIVSNIDALLEQH